MSRPLSPLKTFWHEHKLLALGLLAGLFILALVIAIVVIFTTPDDGIVGDNSESFDASLTADQQVLTTTPEFGISSYLPITSLSPSYQITYRLTQAEAGNYQFRLILSPYSASSRDACVRRLLTEDFGRYDPLSYDIEITNYVSPFRSLSLADLQAGQLPQGITKSNLYQFGDSPYTVQLYTHTLYDGSTNTYRAVLENDQLKTKPQLFFTYANLPFLDQAQVQSLNTLE